MRKARLWDQVNGKNGCFQREKGLLLYKNETRGPTETMTNICIYSAPPTNNNEEIITSHHPSVNTAEEKTQSQITKWKE